MTQARADRATGRIELLIDGRWRRVTPAVSPAVVRTAWAYAQVGSAVAIDLRPLTEEEARYLALSYSPETLTTDEQRRLALLFGRFTSVNLNPATAMTASGNALIATDQLIFDILPLADLRGQQGDVVAGLSTADLRQRTIDDLRDFLNDPNHWRRTLKSIISFSKVDASVTEDEVRIRSEIHFLVCAVPAQGRARAAGVAPRILRRSSQWFDDHADELRNGHPFLRDVADFASTTAVMRAVLRSGIPHDFHSLAGMETPLIQTPRFLCRAHLDRGCSAEVLKTLLDRR